MRDGARTERAQIALAAAARTSNTGCEQSFALPAGQEAPVGDGYPKVDRVQIEGDAATATVATSKNSICAYRISREGAKWRVGGAFCSSHTG